MTTAGDAARPAARHQAVDDAKRDALAEWIAASARGDDQAFQRLYRATSDALFGIALRMCKRRDWAEEVLQESFVSVWRHAARYDSAKGTAMTWLIRIVRNQSLDWMAPSRPDSFEQRLGVPIDVLDADELDRRAVAGGTDRSVDSDSAREAQRIARCLAALDARQRQSITLVFFHGLSHSDLARHLRQPLGTVKAWVRRGLKALRTCLGG